MRSAAICFVACCLPGIPPSVAQPLLPRLALDTYPPAAREPIARAHERAVERPSDARAAGDLGRILHAWEQWAAARESYARAAALAPRAFEWPYLEAVVLQRLARPADAVARLEAALAIRPEYLPARLRLAEALLDAGELDRSEAAFARLTDPSAEPSVQLGLGRIAAARADHGRAIGHFERAIALYPEFGAAHYSLALSLRAAGRRDDARVALERHAQFGARWPAVEDPIAAAVPALREDASALLQRGVRHADAGDLDAAIAAHEAALAGDPTLAQAHANLISLYGRTRDWAKAEAHYRAVVKLAVNVADAHYDYGVLLGLQERWDDAAGAYRDALALNPLHAQARNNLGQIYERQRKLEEAAAEYSRAVDSRPTLRIARFNLGRMLIALGRPDEAARELQMLTEPRDAEAPRYLFALATAHMRAGRKDEGLRWAAEARDLALKHGDTTLASAIERELVKIR
jgi:tetratricopeptide (TPR) repeat protein